MKRKMLYIPDSFEKAIVLNGTNQYVQTAVAEADYNWSTEVTVGGWFKQPTTPSISGREYISNNRVKLEVRTGGDRVGLVVGGQFATSADVFPHRVRDLQWHFIVATYNKVVVKIYIDEQLIRQENRSNSFSNPNQPFTIGGDYNGSNLLAITAKCVFACNKALSATTIQELYAVGPQSNHMLTILSGQGCVGLWPFNNNLNDISGLGHHLTAFGSPTYINVNGSEFNMGSRGSI